MRGNDFHRVTLNAQSTGHIHANRIRSLEIRANFGGLIEQNDLGGAGVAVLYGAEATLSGNRIHGSTVGIRVTETMTTGGLGFVANGGDIGSPNEIFANGIGVEMFGRMQNQHVFENNVGVVGSGVLGGESLALANVIERNATGVHFDGTVQFNQVGHNSVGIEAPTNSPSSTTSFSTIKSRVFSSIKPATTRIVHNTMTSLTGDNIRIDSGSSETEIRNNILNSAGRANIYVSDDSHAGFFSDFNLMQASGGRAAGPLV